MRRGLTFFIVVIACFSLCSAAEPVEFNRDIRPILSDTCYKCHGPDSTQRQAELRLDTRGGIYDKRGDSAPVVPENLGQSELWRRVSSDDASVRMPPPDSGLSLTKQQTDLVKRWIEEGAPWQPHWSFLPPERPEVPEFPDNAWGNNEIDAFILRRLKAEGLTPSPQADKRTLIRRVCLDLTGLPPTLQQIERFLDDDASEAYERLVERLLASDRYGERMAVHWLDLARYADTSGYQNDGPRHMWRWRDWVIEAYNANMPFDQFTIEQLAGDMLPGATLSQRIATGFNRNHRGNAEGGIIPEEFAVEYVVDRVETTGAVWLGLTIGCARCHEHKFDPISQKEFYQLFAYFNNVPESGRAIKEGNSPPFIKAPTPQQQARLRAYRKAVESLTERRKKAAPRRAAAQQEWERTFEPNASLDWNVDDGLLAYWNGSVKRRDLAWLPAEPDSIKSPLGSGVTLGGRSYGEIPEMGNFGYFDKFSIGVWVRPDEPLSGTIVSRMELVDRGSGYNIHLRGGHVELNLVKRWLDDSLRVATKTTLKPGVWQHVAFTYDGSRTAEAIRIYVNGVSQPLKVNFDGINQSFASEEPFRIGAGNSNFQGAVDEVRVYDRALEPDEIRIVATSSSIAEILETPAEKRSADERHKLAVYFETRAADDEIRELRRRWITMRREAEAFYESIPTVMVMEELETPQQTHVLERGQYDQPGEPVSPGIPEALGSLPAGAPNDRLGLARWLVDRDNPLTARVVVNRVWRMHFGTGLVETAEDFGSQGTPPSHPELLDWLAVEFMESGWDVKALHRKIVASATYRQSSHAPAALWKRDPNNRLLARGPRFRLGAEAIRDQALAISGLLVNKVGGPSVKPYQPAGLWKEIATTQNYDQSHGEDLYRRSLYTYWKRTVAPPTLTNFDAVSRETCVVRRARTNTPLQALTLLNDVTFVEAARVLAQRVMREGGKTAGERLAYAFELATARPPRAAELAILERAFEKQQTRFRSNSRAARRYVQAGESPVAKDLDPVDLASYAAVAGIILNLDEVVTRE